MEKGCAPIGPIRRNSIALVEIRCIVARSRTDGQDEEQFGSIQLHDQPDTHFFPEHPLEETLLYSDLF
jgi:hypothetical protein